MKAAELRVERFTADIDGKLTMINEKIDKVQTWEYIDAVMTARIKEVNDDLQGKFKKQEIKVELEI